MKYRYRIEVDTDEPVEAVHDLGKELVDLVNAGGFAKADGYELDVQKTQWSGIVVEQEPAPKAAPKP